MSAIVVLQRNSRAVNVGNVFDYTSYAPGAKLIKLSPPTADGVRTTICCDAWPEYSQLDIQSYDISFDAKSIVFSGRLSGNERYQLYILTLTDQGTAAGPPAALPTNPLQDFVYPIWLPKDRILFVTNESVEAGAPQHQDEYERQTTTQLGYISKDGVQTALGPRNLSHRVTPTLLSDGRVLFTQWDHLGEMNDGHLMIANPDMTQLREAFGKEGTGIANSYLKAVEMEPGRLVAIGTSRDRTIQSGALLDVRLGSIVDGVYRQSEATASVKNLTPMVPLDRVPSFQTVGRYYDAVAVKSNGTVGDNPFLLVSWADGPVEERTLSAGGLSPDFGVYLYDSSTGTRLPIFNDAGTWEVMPRLLEPRPAPPAIDDFAPNMYSSTKVLIGSMNVYNSSITSIPAGTAVKVKIIEGFSVEEGIPMNFGLTEDEGAAMLGEAPVFSDGSWAALVPANVPIHLQVIDKYDMVLANETVWFSGRPGENRMCGGCHESRSQTTVINPGITMALAGGSPPDFDRPRANRQSLNFNRGNAVGIPWDNALQPIFDANCTSCHDGVDRGDGANPTETFVDNATGQRQTFTFNLKGDAVNLNVGGEMLSGYSASHLSLMGTKTLELTEKGITLLNPIPVMVEPKDPASSMLFKKLNAPQMYPYNNSVKWMSSAPYHQTATNLTENQWYLLLNMAGNGGQFYSRENAPY